ncbi:NUDIX domain-containing protein [Candidatus Woesearchaeota archaeon]|nr:MAG: NUDIX domain-containing protein [Candidatus Woesearchaeota archaeon]
MDFKELLKQFDHLPKFPDGRINYSNADTAVVLNCFVKFGDEILLLKRSDKVNAYKGKWNSIGGYLDEPVSLRKKVLEELREELGIITNIKSLSTAEPHTLVDKAINKTWIIFPVLVELSKKPEITLDWEHTDFVWIKPEQINDYDVVPDVPFLLKRVLKR